MVVIKSKPVKILIRLKVGHQAQNFATFHRFFFFFSPIRYVVRLAILEHLYRDHFCLFSYSMLLKNFNVFAVRASGLELISRTRWWLGQQGGSILHSQFKDQVLGEIIKNNKGRKTNTLEKENLISEAAFG